jgi:hypothetical protein
MPATPSPLSVTSQSRCVLNVPAKVYIALYKIYGDDPHESKRTINDLARALLLRHFFSDLKGSEFVSAEEYEELAKHTELPSLSYKYSEKDWAVLIQEFQALPEELITPEGRTRNGRSVTEIPYFDQKTEP